MRYRLEYHEKQRVFYLDNGSHDEFWSEMGISPEIKTIKNSTPIYWVKE